MFAETGFVRVEGAFPRTDAQMMCDVIWGVFERNFGILRADRSTWDRPFRKGPLNELGDSELFWSIFSDRLMQSIDELLGPGCWQLPQQPGDFLITFPNAQIWALPHEGWHSDDAPSGLIAFVLLSDVESGGGGTLLVQGTHRLERRVTTSAMPSDGGRKWKHRAELALECGWLRDLRSPGDPVARRRRFMEQTTEVDGVDLRVVEVTGQAGDAFLVHSRLMHAIAPNAASVPRFMRTPRIRVSRP